MNNEDLLTFSAKAAGISGWWSGDDYCYAHNGNLNVPVPWRPLTDDGDALRLAVACNLLIDTGHCCAMPINRTGEAKGDWSGGMLDDDRDAATRLAIVRAAAEIGRAMP